MHPKRVLVSFIEHGPGHDRVRLVIRQSCRATLGIWVEFGLTKKKYPSSKIYACQYALSMWSLIYYPPYIVITIWVKFSISESISVSLYYVSNTKNISFGYTFWKKTDQSHYSKYVLIQSSFMDLNLRKN